MKGRDALRELLGAGKLQTTPSDIPAKRTSGAVKAMNLGLQRLADEAATGRSLQATLAAAEQVLELDPHQVDASFVSDRIAAESDPGFAELKAAILAHGQQVPILVRPHPDIQRRYQAAYGHRRLRVARDIGVPVKAIVRALSDSELVVAQGQENSERRDLSFIERAVFASHLDQRKFDRDTITAALGIDKPELSRLLTVVGAVESMLIMAIGPAPKVGRPRWLALSEKINQPEAKTQAKRVLETDSFRNADSNARFNIVLSAVIGSEQNNKPLKNALNTSGGHRVAWIERTRHGMRLTSDQAQFIEFLDARLPELLREFEEHNTIGNSRGNAGGE